VIELNPGLAIAYRNRAELFSAAGRLTEAVADYGRAIDSLPNDPELSRARGYALQRLGEFDRAQSEFDRAIALAPNDANAYVERGNLAAERGRFDKAIADFQRAIEIDVNLADAHRCRAWLEATCSDERYRDARRALANATKAAELAPHDFLVLDTLAAAHACAGQFDEAVEVQHQALAVSPPHLAEPLRERLAFYTNARPSDRGAASTDVRRASHDEPRNYPSLPPRR